MTFFKTKYENDEVTITLTDEGDGCVVVSVNDIDLLRFLPDNRGIATIWNNEGAQRKLESWGLTVDGNINIK